MRRAAAANAHIIDVVAYPFITDLDQVLAEFPADRFGKYENHLKFGGVKITLDGSPQGRTAWFTKPYLVDGPNGEKNWRGEPGIPRGAGQGVVQEGLRPEPAPARPRQRRRGHRPAAARPRVRRRRATSTAARPSSTPSSCGWTSSTGTSPTSSSLVLHRAHLLLRRYAHAAARQGTGVLPEPDARRDRQGLRPTNHTDFNVSPIDQMFVVWTAVNRVSRGGEVIGPDQRVTPLEALKAITINAAYQYFEEKSKGSIETGQAGGPRDPRQEPAQGRAHGDQGHQGRRDDQGRKDDLPGTLTGGGRRRMNRVRKRVGLAIMVLASGCGTGEPAMPADGIYFGGDIITMAGDSAAVRRGRCRHRRPDQLRRESHRRRQAERPRHRPA